MYISSDFFVRQTSIRFIIVASLFIAVRGYVREEMLPVSCVIDRLVSMGCRAPDCCAEGCVVVVVVSFLVSFLFYPISLHLFLFLLVGVCQPVGSESNARFVRFVKEGGRRTILTKSGIITGSLPLN